MVDNSIASQIKPPSGSSALDTAIKLSQMRNQQRYMSALQGARASDLEIGGIRQAFPNQGLAFPSSTNE